MKRTAISRRPSKRKQAFDAEYAKVLPEVLARRCQFVSYVVASEARTIDGRLVLREMGGYYIVDNDGSIERCAGRELGHHAKGRKAADANDPRNLRCLCVKHHDYVHAHSRFSRQVGLMVSRVS